MKKILSLLIFYSYLAIGQQVAIGKWRSHQSYASARLVEVAGETIFCATENGLFTVDTTAGTLQKLTREGGLGDVGVSAMSYSAAFELMIIGYESGLVDIIRADGSIKTLTTLKDAELIADRAIHDISNLGSQVYMATEFGVVFLDLATETIKENYRDIGPGGNGVSVKEVSVTIDSLYILTDLGIQSASLSANLLDFNSWVFHEVSGDFRHLVMHESQQFVIKNQRELLKYDGENWTDTGIIFSDDVQGLTGGTSLQAISGGEIFTAYPTMQSIEQTTLISDAREFIYYADEFWVADASSGLIRIGTATEVVAPQGPQSDAPVRMRSIDGVTYALYGPASQFYDGLSDDKGYSKFENGIWESVEIPDFYNLTDVASAGGNLYFSSLGFGLFNATNGVIINETNSDLIAGGSFAEVQISSLVSYQNSLWLGAYDSEIGLYEFTNGQVTRSFGSDQTNSRFPMELDVSSRGLIWIRRGASDGQGVAVINPETGEKRTFRVAEGLPSSTVTGLAIDQNDEVWFATVNGPAGFQGASFPFNGFGAVVPIFENAVLLEGEKINAVMTDGGDRLWLGTDLGVWVFSENQTALVHRFTTDNSPLLSNKVLGFSYDGLSGEVFIQTSRGVISYQSASSAAGLTHASVLKIFPNPVHPGYAGDVGISGLIRDATIKITDSKGRLIRELRSNGGTASWDLQNHRGSRVETGVYLIFSSSADGEETHIGKIAVVR